MEKFIREYDPGLLESFENKHPGNDYFVKANCPEFTSLCPITGQPDFANIVISYLAAGSLLTLIATMGNPVHGGNRLRGIG